MLKSKVKGVINNCKIQNKLVLLLHKPIRRKEIKDNKKQKKKNTQQFLEYSVEFE